MPHKPITWIGSFIILAAGGFCSWSLLRYRDAYGIVDTRFNVLTAGVFLTPVVAAVAIFLWYFFNERR